MDRLNDELEVDIKKLLLYYLHHWILIAVCVLSFAVLAFLTTHFFITPKYKADITVYVNNTKNTQSMDSISNTNLTTAQQLVNTYVNIIKSNNVLNKVIQEGDISCSVEDIRSSMTAQQVDNTEMFTVTISHTDPKTATKIANTIAKVAPPIISEIVKGSSTEIIDYATVPASPYSPSIIKNTLLGGVLGGLIIGAFLTIRFLMDVRIKDEDDAESYLKIPVLGTIPEYDEVSKKSIVLESSDSKGEI